MERREAVRNMALLMGSIISIGTMGVILESCNGSNKPGEKFAFAESEQLLIAEIADLILPTTDTPGAKAAGVGAFITMMISECFPKEVHVVFVEGLKDLENRSKKVFNKDFLSLSLAQKNQLLKDVATDTTTLRDEEKAKITATDVKGPKKIYFFQIIRELTLLGYFTSEIGATKALAYIPVPGYYDGDVNLKPGQKAWAF